MLSYKEAGLYSDYKKLLKPRIPFTVSKQGHAIGPKLSTIRNTIVTCTLCRGTRLNAIKSYDGTVKMSKCMDCAGSGVKDQIRELTP